MAIAHLALHLHLLHQSLLSLRDLIDIFLERADSSLFFRLLYLINLSQKAINHRNQFQLIILEVENLIFVEILNLVLQLRGHATISLTQSNYSKLVPLLCLLNTSKQFINLLNALRNLIIKSHSLISLRPPQLDPISQSVIQFVDVHLRIHLIIVDIGGARTAPTHITTHIHAASAGRVLACRGAALRRHFFSEDTHRF